MKRQTKKTIAPKCKKTPTIPALVLGQPGVISETSYDPTLSRRGSNHRYIVPCSKGTRRLIARSQLEMYATLCSEFTRNITAITSEPTTFRLRDSEGAEFNYTPDLLVEFDDGTCEYLEIKYTSRLNDVKTATRLAQITEAFRHAGIKFRVVTEETIQPSLLRLENYSYLLGYRGDSAVHLPTTDFKPMSLIDFANRFLKGNTTEVMELIACQELFFHPDQLISLHMEVSATPTPNYDIEWLTNPNPLVNQFSA